MLKPPAAQVPSACMHAPPLPPAMKRAPATDYSIIVGGYVVIVLSDTSHRYNPANSSSGSPPLKCTLCVQRTDSAGQRPLGRARGYEPMFSCVLSRQTSAPGSEKSQQR